MLTRLEVDGFKNLLDVSVDFGPYTCIAGTNGVGKSNLFDAIEFLSLLADYPFMEAAQRLRSAGPRGGDPRTLFYDIGGDDAVAGEKTFRLTAEMIVPSSLEDDFGRPVRPTTSFLRYEVVLAYQAPETSFASQLGRLSLVSEELRHINLGEAASHLPWQHSKRQFRDKVVFGRRSGTAYISTKMVVGSDSVGRVVNVHQDGGSRGQPRTSPAERAPRTVVSTTTTSDDPTILAARREMQQWRLLSLEPSAMRSPDALSDPTEIGSNGAHLAAALHRLQEQGGGLAYGAVAAAASALTDVREVTVDVDQHRELLTLQARVGKSPLLPARALSDGTLRFLALCIMYEDPRFTGLLCMEEPENGIHPGRINAMVDLVRDLAVDPDLPPDAANPLRQVIVNTHSPHFVQFQHADDVLVAVTTTVKREGKYCSTFELLPLAGTWRSKRLPSMSRAAIVEYLTKPPGAQLTLDMDGVA